MRPQRVRIIGIISGWVTLKKPFSDTSMHAVPLLARVMPGNTASSWMPALLTRIWIGPASSSASSAAAVAARVGDVEGHGLGAAAGGVDPRGQRLRRLEAAVGVHDDVEAVGGQARGRWPRRCRRCRR